MTNAAVLLDVDGTLIDSNDAHARAWVDVGREFGLPIHFETIRPLIGMGSDKVIPIVAGVEKESGLGSRLAERHGELFRSTYLPRLRVFHGTHAMLERMARAGFTLVVATSAGKEDMKAIFRHARLEMLIDDRTSSSDVEASKPDPDIVHAALDKAGVPASRALFVGDTPYDIEAATRAGVPCVGLRCGGWWSDDELAGAVALYDDPAALIEAWDDSPFARLAADQRASRSG